VSIGGTYTFVEEKMGSTLTLRISGVYPMVSKTDGKRINLSKVEMVKHRSPKM